jgi:hypothetical protein
LSQQIIVKLFMLRYNKRLCCFYHKKKGNVADCN